MDRTTSEALIVDGSDVRISLLEPGTSVPFHVQRSVKLNVEEDGPERFTVRYGPQTLLGSCLLPLERGLRTIAFDVSIDGEGTLDLHIREYRPGTVDPFHGEFLSVLKKESDKGRPWVEEHVVAALLGIPTRREMVHDERWLQARDTLLAMKLIERRVHREPTHRGYTESRQLAIIEGAKPARSVAAHCNVSAVLTLSGEAPELVAPRSAVESLPRLAPIEDRIRSVAFWLLLSALVLFALARAWT